MLRVEVVEESAGLKCFRAVCDYLPPVWIKYRDDVRIKMLKDTPEHLKRSYWSEILAQVDGAHRRLTTC